MIRSHLLREAGPPEMWAPEVTRFLTALAVRGSVAASTSAARLTAASGGNRDTPQKHA